MLSRVFFGSGQKLLLVHVIRIGTGLPVYLKRIWRSRRLIRVHVPGWGGGGGGTPIYGLYRYVPRDRVWFLRFSVLKWGIIFAPFGIVFPVLSLDRVPKFYQLK